MKVSIYFIGKPRDTHANAIAAEFLKRATRYCDCTQREILPSKFDLFARHGSARKILLDPAGKPINSDQFADIFRKAELIGQDLVFLVGGHDGLPPEWRDRADLLLSISAMTYPHELARAVLMEQIYRAFTILRGHPYPR
ncbi:MAG: 23S rRNA (pseudouridine(1915)-N(3))-methyltransferase RlmH [Bryobacteraceae bacterium]